MKRFAVVALVLTAVAGLIAGCAGPSISAADMGRLESIETTPVVFPAAETTACPGLLACVERVDAPLPVVRRSSPPSGPASSSSAEDCGSNLTAEHAAYIEARRQAILELTEDIVIPSAP